MRGKRNILLAFLCLSGMILLGACQKKESADEYMGKCITELKEKDDALSFVLESGIAESNELYMVQFPEELKSPYMDFLKEALNQVEFNVKPAQENGKGDYKVKVYFEPLDILDTTGKDNEMYLQTLEADNLNTSVSDMLKTDKELLENGKKRAEAYQTIEVKGTDDGYEISEDSLKELVKAALVDYMEPYNSAAELFDQKDFLQSYLDADLKGEVSQFAKHAAISEEEALALYESGFELEDMGLSEEMEERYTNAMKSMFKNCDYRLGKVTKSSDTGCMVEVITKPNLSLTTALSEVKNGTYYSEAEVSEALVSICEKYASAPVFGDETTVTINWNTNTMAEAANPDSELRKLELTIIPIPE